MIEIFKPFFDGLRPVPRITVSEWANKYARLNQKSSAEFGKYRVERAPYLREIMDCLSKDSHYEQIDVMKGVQLGFSEAGNCWIAYTIHVDPGPMMVVMPTLDLVKKNSSSRIEPMIESIPEIRDKVSKKGDRGQKNTVQEKEFQGGFLMMVAAQSPTGLSSTPVSKVFLDELDRYPQSSGSEGSPISLAIGRTSTFSNRKIYCVSTPVLQGESLIEKEFNKGDCKYYHVPCLHCEELFIITLTCLTWDNEVVKCACPNCGGLHEERHKTKMFADKKMGGRAEWIATKKTSDPKRTSFHISSLYSPAGWWSWEKILREYQDAFGDENKMKTFTNLRLGEPFKITAEVPDADMLYDRRENYEVGVVPAGVHFLTMGVDTQNDRIEYDVVGWGPGRESWDVKYGVLEGDTAKPEVWEKLSEVVDSQFPTHDGNFMALRQVAIDSQGHRTSEVYAFCKKHGYSKVIPIRGANVSRNTGVMVTQSKATTVTKAGKKIGGDKVWTVDTYMLKEELYANLRLTSVEGKYPPGYCHFPMYERHYFKMLTAEELRLQKDAKGFDKWQWVKVFERNEVLDMRGYARAAAYLVGIDRLTEKSWQKIKDDTTVKMVDSFPESKPEKTDRKIKKSDYWNRKR